jgi:hypothetical protein
LNFIAKAEFPIGFCKKGGGRGVQLGNNIVNTLYNTKEVNINLELIKSTAK